LSTDYRQAIQDKGTSALLSMLDEVESGRQLAAWPPGRAFEHIILRAFDIEGAEVTWPYSVPLEGVLIEQIDGAVHLDNLHCLIEAKDRDETQGVEPVAKLRNQIMRRPASTIGLVFTTSQYSIPAKMLTRMMNPLSILLWEYQELRQAVEEKTMCRSLKTKFKYAVERRMPDYNVRKELR